MARPTIFSQELADQLIQALAEGQTLRQVCAGENMPAPSTVLDWVAKDRQGFKEQYRLAREFGYLLKFDEMFEIADDGRNDWMASQNEDDTVAYRLNGEHVQRSRLRIDTIKWALAKALPKVFGDKVALVGGGEGDDPIKVTRIELVAADVRPPD